MKQSVILSLISILQFVAIHAGKLVYVNTPMKAGAAKAYCESQYGGHLASIHSAAQNALIASLCVNQGQVQAACWLGMSNVVTPTKWFDGTSIDFTSWYVGEPDAPGSQNCVVMRQGLWHTVGYCELHALPFICEQGTLDWVAQLNVGGWTLFEGTGKWYECPAGYVVAGFWKNYCQQLYCLEEMRCVAPQISPIVTQTCYDKNIWSTFDNAGTVECDAGYFVRGIWSNDNEDGQCGIYCWEYLRCCKYDTNQLTDSGITETQNWWGCFDGSNTGWCLVDSDEYITGFMRTAGDSQLYQLEEAKVRKLFKSASVVGIPETPQFDNKKPFGDGYYFEISKPVFLAILGLVAAVIIVNIIMACCIKRNKNGNKGYGVVKHVDSESEDV